MKAAVKIFGLVVICAYFYFGLLVEPSEPCGLDNASLWCNLHPFTVLDLMGTILFIAGTLILTGWAEGFIDKEDLNPKGVRIWSGIVIIISFLLTLI